MLGRSNDVRPQMERRRFSSNGPGKRERDGSVHAYPEVDVQVLAAAKLSVADLECHRHLVVLVQLLVEAFSRVRAEIYVVGESRAQQRACEEKR